MRIYNAPQRARIHELTHIDPFIIDRCCSAYEALINSDDVEGYRKNMLDAMAQLGFGIKIPEEEKPTAVDKMKVLVVRSIAYQWRVSYTQAKANLESRLKE